MGRDTEREIGLCGVTGKVATLEAKVALDLAPLGDRTATLERVMDGVQAEAGSAVRATTGCETRLGLITMDLAGK